MTTQRLHSSISMICLHCSVKKMQGWGVVYLPSLLPCLHTTSSDIFSVGYIFLCTFSWDLLKFVKY